MGTAAKTTEVRAGPLHVTVAQTSSICTLSLRGELDLSNVEAVGGLLSEFEAGDGEVIVLDLVELEFIDSTGIALLIDAHRRLEADARLLRIVPSRATAVRRIFTITGLDEKLPFVSDRPSA